MSVTTPPHEDSLKTRYTAKLAANGLGLVVGAATQSITARVLGPGAYGIYSFLMNFFNQVLGFFEMGTSMGFYTKVSQRPGETAVVRFYWFYTLIVGLVVFALVCTVFFVGAGGRLWPGQATLFVWLSLGLAVLLSFVQILNNMVDGYGLTVAGEMSRNKQRVIGLGLIALLAACGELTLRNYFLYNILIVSFLGWLWLRILGERGVVIFIGDRLTREEVRRYAGEFYDYGAPLAAYSMVGALGNLFDRWLLQSVSGSIEQGFYGFAYQLSSLAFVFSGAMTPLLTRELAVAFAASDRERMRALFVRSVKVLYSVTAALGLLLAVAAPEISRLFGGRRFAGATWALGFMMLYPLYQTIGQFSGSVFFATGQTKAYRNLGTGILVAGLPVSYFLLAPAPWGGWHMGALGLSLKMVGLQTVGVNLLLWHNSKSLGLSFRNFLGHQAMSTMVFGTVACVAAFLGRILSQTNAVRLGWIAFFYGMLTALIVFRFPGLMGFRAEDVRWFMNQLRRWKVKGGAA